MPATRRELLFASAAACGTIIANPAFGAAETSFDFVHITDLHIQHELDADKGVHKALKAAMDLKSKPSFALIGGDLVMDASLVPRDTADRLFGMWSESAEGLKIPLHYSIGNHDLFGLKMATKATANIDQFKALWKQRLGLAQTYSHFDHQGWRFVTLDSAGVTPDLTWEGELHEDQIRWLDDLLRATPRTMPLVFLTHYPIFTACSLYINGVDEKPGSSLVVKNCRQFREMIQKHNVKAVLQGHTHIVEEVEYLGVRYITGGAVCGEWWKGPRLGLIPEGFMSYSVRGENLASRYVTYGWKAKVG